MSNEELLKTMELKERYSKVSNYVLGRFKTSKDKRKTLESKWLKNRRQYDGIDENYSLRKEVRDGRSKTYEKYTTLKVDQLRARLYELFMPTGDKNFSLFTSNNPVLPKNKMSNVIQNLESQYKLTEEQIAQGQQQLPLPKSIIQKAIQEIAEENAGRLEKLMEDILVASNYEEIVQKLTLSAGIFGSGVVIGPLLKPSKKISYEQDDFGNWVVKEKMEDKPYFEYVDIFEWFPDLDAKTREDIDFTILYKVCTKTDLLKLCNNPTYISESIKDFIKNHEGGNYDYQWYEQELQALSSESLTIKPNKFRITEFWGNVDTSLVKDLIPELENEEKLTVSVNIVMLDSTVIKCILNPFDSEKIPVHYFNLYTKGGQLTGGSLCDLLEEKQRQLNACVRAKFDNMATNATPMIEINRDLILPQDMPDKLNPGRIIFRTGMGDQANYPAIRQLALQNAMMEYLQVEQSIKSDMDTISSLSGILTGDMSDVGKTLGRTSSGVNALMGGSNTNLKDITKQFDNFSKYLYEMLIEVIFLVNEEEDIRGDFQVFPKVSTAIVEKQLNANNLSMLLSQLQPEQRQMFDWKGVTKQQVLYSNLDPDFVLLNAEDIAQKEQQAQMQQQQMSDMQSQMAQQKMQLDQQKVQIDGMKAQSKGQVDMAKAQEILNNIENSKNKGELDSMLALHKIDNDRTTQSLNEANTKHDIISSEFDRQERFHQEQMAQKQSNEQPKEVK